jgi:transposase InsO family protein
MTASANIENENLRDRIQQIALEFPGYGYRRIAAELRNRSYTINHKRILRLMRQDNLLCLKRQFKPVTTDSNHGLPVLSQPSEEHQDYRAKPGVGFGYHIRSVAA